MNNNKKQIRVLLTSSRGCIASGRVELLKNNPNYDFYVIGLDASSDSFKLPLLDEQIRVPFGQDENYISELKKVSLEKRADVIIPASDYEVEIIAKHRQDFTDLGVGCVCSPYEVTHLAINKATMLLTSREHGVAVPEFEIPKNINEFKAAAARLGYPAKQLVFKPAFSGGGNRGVWLVRDDFSDDLLRGKGIPYISLEDLIQQLERLPEFPGVVLMEYLPGDEYSVDGLSDALGNPVYVIPRVRVSPLPGYSQEGLIEESEEVSAYVAAIARVFKFTSNFNIQLKRSESGSLRVYEINPRVSATVVANAGAGVDIFLFGILQAAGLDYPKNLKYQKTRMIRFWTEFYAHQ